jgi:hypothetical protein
MPTKKLVKKKPSVVTIPVSWLLAGALFLGAAMVVQAVNSKKQVAGINQIKTAPASNVKEGTFTGVVSREVANPNEKEKYVLTTDSGTKYILIGLKKSYEDKETKERLVKIKEERVKAEKVAGKPAPKQKMPPKPDTEDTNSFEQYEGLKVTIIGMVVPVMSDDNNRKELLPPASPQVKKNSTAETERTGKAVRPVISPTPKRSPDPAGGWDYERLVVKAIAVAE